LDSSNFKVTEKKQKDSSQSLHQYYLLGRFRSFCLIVAGITLHVEHSKASVRLIFELELNLEEFFSRISIFKPRIESGVFQKENPNLVKTTADTELNRANHWVNGMEWSGMERYNSESLRCQ
jgi:hypothetical protein